MVRPLTQKKLKQVCKKFKEWGDKFGFTLPNLQELENPINWSTWIAESKVLERTIANNVLNDSLRVWRWLNGNVSVVVYFEYLDPNWLLKTIKARYYDKENPDHHSFNQVGVPIIHKGIGSFCMPYWETKSGGRKSSQLIHMVVNNKQKYDSAVNYRELSMYLTSVRGNQKIKRKMFPYCRCISNPRPKVGNFPIKSYLKTSTGDMISFQCNKCVAEINQPNGNQVHTHPTN
jgi:hypothetical protein